MNKNSAIFCKVFCQEIENFSREAKPTERNLDLSVACGLSVVETINLLFNLSRAGN